MNKSFALLLMLTLPSWLPAAAPQEQPPILLQSVAPRAAEARVERSFAAISLRHGEVVIDTAALTDERAVGREFLLDLFPDVAAPVRIERKYDDGFGPVWKGTIGAPAEGDLTLVGDGDRITGSIVGSLGRYQIVASGPGRAVIFEIDAGAQLPDIMAAPEFRSSSRRVAAAGRADTSVIDVMVLFTQAAKKQQPPIAGGLKGLIRVAVANMNTAMDNSQIDIEVRLVKLKKLKYQETGSTAAFMSGALRDLTGSADGHMDTVHKLRDRFGADYVALVLERNDELCGLAWIGGERAGLVDGDGNLAFSVTAWRCLAFDTLAHEIGHNMGAQHAHEDPVSELIGAYDYAYGYKVEQKLRTIMAYLCAAGCDPFLAYSNPAVTMNDTPAGVPAGAAEPADNHRAFNNDRHVMEAYRACKVKCDERAIRR